MVWPVILFSIVHWGFGCPSNISGMTVTTAINYAGTKVCSYTISDCMFMSVSGTAVSIESLKSTVSIIANTFSNCLSNKNKWTINNGEVVGGGAMRLYAATVLLSSCCGHMCSTLSYGHFSSVETTERLYMEDVSAVLRVLSLYDICSERSAACGAYKFVIQFRVFFDGAALESSKAVSFDMRDCSLVSCVGRGILSLLTLQLTRKEDCVVHRVNIVNNTIINDDCSGLLLSWGIGH